MSYTSGFRCAILIPTRNSNKIDVVSQKATQKFSFFCGDSIVIGIGNQMLFYRQTTLMLEKVIESKFGDRLPDFFRLQ